MVATVTVIDGDTLEFHGQPMRLHVINAPLPRRGVCLSPTGKGVGERINDEFARRIVQALGTGGQVLFGRRDHQLQVYLLREADPEPKDVIAHEEVSNAKDIGREPRLPSVLLAHKPVAGPRPEQPPAFLNCVTHEPIVASPLGVG